MRADPAHARSPLGDMKWLYDPLIERLFMLRITLLTFFLFEGGKRESD